MTVWCLSPSGCLRSKSKSCFPERNRTSCPHPSLISPSLFLLMNIVSSLSAFPFQDSPIARINYLQQLLYEVDYRSYPFAAQVLREVGSLSIVSCRVNSLTGIVCRIRIRSLRSSFLPVSTRCATKSDMYITAPVFPCWMSLPVIDSSRT